MRIWCGKSNQHEYQFSIFMIKVVFFIITIYIFLIFIYIFFKLVAIAWGCYRKLMVLDMTNSTVSASRSRPLDYSRLAAHARATLHLPTCSQPISRFPKHLQLLIFLNSFNYFNLNLALTQCAKQLVYKHTNYRVHYSLSHTRITGGSWLPHNIVG